MHHHPWSTHLVIPIISCLEGTDRRGSPKNSQKSRIIIVGCHRVVELCSVAVCILRESWWELLSQILHKQSPTNDHLVLIYRDARFSWWQFNILFDPARLPAEWSSLYFFQRAWWASHAIVVAITVALQSLTWYLFPNSFSCIWQNEPPW